MDGSKGRRTATGISFSRGGCIITLREQNYHDRSVRCCSRLGCSASLYAMKGTQVGKQDRASFHSGPCQSLSANGFRKPQRGQRSSCSREEAMLQKAVIPEEIVINPKVVEDSQV